MTHYKIGHLSTPLTEI